MNTDRRTFLQTIGAASVASLLPDLPAADVIRIPEDIPTWFVVVHDKEGRPLHTYEYSFE